MSPRVVHVTVETEVSRTRTDDTMASPPARFMITQRVAWKDPHTPKGALRWRWGTVAAVALSKMDDGQLAYEYLIAGGDGSMYLRWDHQLLRPSDGDVERFRENRVLTVGGARRAAHSEAGDDEPEPLPPG
jgi:hypothetical protein